jgi:DNA-binding HxlR family transcriptional regulator
MSLHKSKLPGAEACPIRDVLDRIGDRWTLLVLVALLEGRLRFGQLAKHIPDISERMLSKTLRNLEQDGIVERRAFAEVPPRVEYALTALGQSMSEPVLCLIEWADTNHAAIRVARRRFEARRKPKV